MSTVKAPVIRLILALAPAGSVMRGATNGSFPEFGSNFDPAQSLQTLSPKPNGS